MKIYIYILIDSTTNKVRYVDKTNNIGKRRRYHFNLNTQSKFKTHSSKWLIKLLSNNIKPVMKIIDTIESDNWEWLEKFYIKLFKKLGCDLTNHSIGGDSGNSGNKMSKEFCEKQSKLKMGRIVPQDVIDEFKKRIKGNTYQLGEKNHKSKLNELEVIKICELLSEGLIYSEIIQQIPKCNLNIIGLIKGRRSWKHISKNYKFKNDGKYSKRSNKTIHR